MTALRRHQQAKLADELIESLVRLAIGTSRETDLVATIMDAEERLTDKEEEIGR